MADAAAACCLYEGDYHLGVATLANSLFRNGFRGTLWIGKRGAVPGWAGAIDSSGRCRVSDGFDLAFIDVPEGRHIAQMKSWLLLNLFNRGIGHETLAYFDADCVVISPWSFFNDWVRNGVALVQDIGTPWVSMHHPWREQWRKLVAEAGLSVVHSQDSYFCSGFIGVGIQHRALIENWDNLHMMLARREPELGKVLKAGGRDSPFANPDQDLLNAALMTAKLPIAWAGSEAFSLSGTAYGMAQSIIESKPWRGGYLRRALHGRPPGFLDKQFWAVADGPLHPFPPLRLAGNRGMLRIAAAIGRFYRRT